MEVFGTVGTAVSLVEACSKLVVALDRYIDEVKHAKANAQGLKEQVLGIKDVLTRLERVYNDAQDQAKSYSTEGHPQADWFEAIANEMEEDKTWKDFNDRFKKALDDITTHLELPLGPMMPASPGASTQSLRSQPRDENTSIWRVGKAYLLWPARRKKVETWTEKMKQYIQGMNDLHRIYQDRFANRRTQATEEILAYTQKKEQEDEQRRIEKERRRIEEEQRRREELEQRRREEEQRRKTEEQRHREEEERRREKEQQEKLSTMMKKLGDPSEHLSRHTMWCDKRTKGTCQWIMKDRAFRKWKDGDGGGCLWLYGGPGMGKTFLASAVIDELTKSGPVSYVYCDSKCTTARGILELLAAQSLRQIGKRSTGSWRLRPDAVNFDFSAEFSALEHKDSYSFDDDIPELITTVTKIFEASFIVVDALDECPRQTPEDPLISSTLSSPLRNLVFKSF
ncbi:hypothetical protein NLI96_g12963 [Meripilus lineatus]|uniref:Nephrocystin 3-like N-terminal domain-containing protein n=1 Tax=Meripilus lineatus TaxID=2056292 RepID=A0AAD5UNU8_9APHY|nr:hypothetical protein NLI96_g12963 [Physisporinus lineatus]